MTAPQVQEEVGTDKFQRLDSTISEIVEEHDQMEELRGVPIEHRGIESPIEEVRNHFSNFAMTLISNVHE